MLTVQGGTPLSGSVTISGSKNAALPILGASLLVKGKVRLNNMPKIKDVETFLEILSSVGVTYEWTDGALLLDSSHLRDDNFDFEKVKKVRASIFLLSPILYYFKNITIPFPGGCKIGKRPIDNHLEGLKNIGYDYKYEGEMIKLFGKLEAGDITLDGGFSVSATENLLVANALRAGQTIIKNAALEPHVMNVVDFLRTAGADIKIRYNHDIIVTGVDSLNNDFEFDIISDYIESGTFIVLAAVAAESYLDIHNARIDDLYTFLQKAKQVGVKFEDLGNDTLRVYKCENPKPVKFQTNIFPGFPTDLQSPFCILLAQATGESHIHEVLFEGRLNFLVELEKMGGEVEIINPHEATITGGKSLKGTMVTSWDLRAGMAMVIAGIIAKGETQVTNVEYIYRGYENFVQKLQSLGADVVDTEK